MIKRFWEYIHSEEVSFREKLFYIIMILGITADLIGALASIPLGQDFVAMLPYFVVAFLMAVLTVYCRKTRNFVVGINISIFALNTFLLPYSFMMNSGVKGGSPIWFILGIIFVAVQVEDAISRGILWGITLISFSICCYIDYTTPEKIVQLENNQAVVFDNYLAILSVSVILCLTIVVTLRMLKNENAISKAQKEEIERLNRAQSAFFSSMSHEIRTPINTIIGLNEMILREDGISDEIIENADNIQSASKMLLGIVNDILDMSRIESGKMEIVPTQYETSKLLADVATMISANAENKGLKFEIRVGKEVPSLLYGDEIRIKQILINLLSNSVKYTKEGSITLSFDVTKSMNSRCHLLIDVSDTGVGIRKESIPHLFDAFSRVEDTETRLIEGTGLGLSICKQLVTLMKGSISVDSIYTKGSTFHVSIPQRVLDDTALEQQEINRIGKHSGSTYHRSFEAPTARVLMVDDNDINRMVVRKLLRETQVLLDEASSGQDALDLTAIHEYDVILMDYLMPQMDGIETLQRIRNQKGGLCRQTPAIALTANAGSEMNRFYLNNGFAGYLPKPIDGSQLEKFLADNIPMDKITYRAYSLNVVGEESISSVANRRKSVIISADGVCDIPLYVIESLDIRTIPFYLETPMGNYMDGNEIDARAALSYLDIPGTRIISQEPTIEQYEEYFGNLLSEAVEVIHLSLSSGVSVAYERAREAAISFSNVRVIDTHNISSGIGFLAIEAAKRAREGNPVEVICERMEKMKGLVCGSMIVNDPTQLMTNGRIGAMVVRMSKIFNLRPVIRVRNGNMQLDRFIMGDVKKAAEKYVRQTLDERNIDQNMLLFCYSQCKQISVEEMIIEMKAMKTERFGQIYYTEANATNASNVGTDAVGLFYMKKLAGDED